MLQSQDQLENRRSKNNKVSREMWEAMKTKAGEVRLAEEKGRKRKKRKEKETRGKRMEKEGEKKNQEREYNRDEKTGREVGNLE